MCKYKDTNLGIKKLDFNVKRGAMAAYLTDGREIIVPVSMFPDIKHLTKKQREDYMIMDDQYFSFEALSKIYSIKDLLRLYFIRCPRTMRMYIKGLRTKVKHNFGRIRNMCGSSRSGVNYVSFEPLFLFD